MKKLLLTVTIFFSPLLILLFLTFDSRAMDYQYINFMVFFLQTFLIHSFETLYDVTFFFPLFLDWFISIYFCSCVGEVHHRLGVAIAFLSIWLHDFHIWAGCEYFLQEFSPDGRFVVSADRDFKIRVIKLYYLLNEWKN